MGRMGAYKLSLFTVAPRDLELGSDGLNTTELKLRDRGSVGAGVDFITMGLHLRDGARLYANDASLLDYVSVHFEPPPEERSTVPLLYLLALLPGVRFDSMLETLFAVDVMPEELLDPAGMQLAFSTVPAGVRGSVAFDATKHHYGTDALTAKFVSAGAYRFSRLTPSEYPAQPAIARFVRAYLEAGPRDGVNGVAGLSDDYRGEFDGYDGPTQLAIWQAALRWKYARARENGPVAAL
jgi:hypothetical protein